MRAGVFATERGAKCDAAVRTLEMLADTNLAGNFFADWLMAALGKMSALGH